MSDATSFSVTCVATAMKVRAVAMMAFSMKPTTARGARSVKRRRAMLTACTQGNGNGVSVSFLHSTAQHGGHGRLCMNSRRAVRGEAATRWRAARGRLLRDTVRVRALRPRA